MYRWPIAISIYTSKMKNRGAMTEEWEDIASLIFGLQEYLLLLQKPFRNSLLSTLQQLAKDLKKLIRKVLHQDIFTITLHRFLDHSAYDFAKNGSLFLRSCKRFEGSYNVLRECSQNETVNFEATVMRTTALVSYVNLCLCSIPNTYRLNDFCKFITKIMHTDIHL